MTGADSRDSDQAVVTVAMRQSMERSGRIAITALGFVLAGAGAGSAQESPPADYPARSIYVEAGGLPAFEGAPYSLSVEQRLIPRTYLRVGVFVGPVDAQMTMK